MSDKETLKGLGGWLILVGIGVVVAPIRLIYEYGPMYYSIFTDGSFEVLTTPGTEAYNSLWGPLLIGEALGNTFLVLASILFIYFLLNIIYSLRFILPLFYSLLSLSLWMHGSVHLLLRMNLCLIQQQLKSSHEV